MNRNYILSCESTVDEPYKNMADRGIPVIFYTYTIGTEIFEDDMKRTPGSTEEFYAKLKAGAKPVTSQINTATYEEYFEKISKENDVLHIAFGSGMSGSVNNAFEAAATIMKKYPDRKIVVVDSLCSSSGYGLLVDYAADMKEAGKPLDDVKQWVEDYRNNVHHQFFCTDLSFFKRSGRVSAVTSLIGTILGICPLMKLNDEGRIVAYSKAHGKRKALDATFEVMKEEALGGKNYDGKCYINHSNSPETAELLKNKVEEYFPNLKGKVKIFDIGFVVGAHCGPGVTALYFLGNPRKHITKK
ncbi:MAG TPA: DegV family protein [Clostridiales bacterium]|nr:DegV family protein [Clostridiales bacterium]